MTTHVSRHVSISIERSPNDVYAFVSNGANLPRWASGLGDTVQPGDDGEWLADGALGPVRVRFAPQNALGVADHDVRLPDQTVHNALRVLPNGSGSEVVFSLFQLPGVSREQLDQDAAHVAKDLQTLKGLLEG